MHTRSQNHFSIWRQAKDAIFFCIFVFLLGHLFPRGISLGQKLGTNTIRNRICVYGECMHLKGLGIGGGGERREGVLGSFGFLLFTICSQWISNMFPKFVVAHDFHLTSFFLGRWEVFDFLGFCCSKCVPTMFLMNFQHVCQVLKMFPITHVFFLISFFGWGEWGVLGFFGFFCSQCVPNEFPICFQNSQDVPNSHSFLKHLSI